MSSTPCQPETILSASTCDIQYCSDCGMIHLIMGAMSLRLSTGHFQELAKDLGKGTALLKARRNSAFNFHNQNVTTLHS
ncbi:MAG: hypothetical protein PSN44_01635 [Gammaproteobacteria bacterium]|nr:hypothetical protein [Gammaproteobacteria bacterium]